MSRGRRECPIAEILAEAESFDDVVHILARRARELADRGERAILGVTGSPGAGKSTLCAALAAELGSRAALVGMDAFHLANIELTRLGRRDRKGAPETFDVGGYVALLRRLRSESTAVVYSPKFVREIEESIGSAIPVDPSVNLVVTEGNYLLHDSGGWERVHGELDEVWYLDVPESVRRDRLIERHRHFGKSLHDARDWTEQVDLRNAAVVAATRGRADLIVAVPDGLEVGDPRR